MKRTLATAGSILAALLLTACGSSESKAIRDLRSEVEQAQSTATEAHEKAEEMETKVTELEEKVEQLEANSPG